MSDSTREYFRSINLVVWQQLRGRSYNVLCSRLTKLSYLTVELKCLFLRQFAWIYNWMSSCRGWKDGSSFYKHERMFRAVHKFFLINHSRIFLRKPEMMTLLNVRELSKILPKEWRPVLYRNNDSTIICFNQLYFVSATVTRGLNQYSKFIQWRDMSHLIYFLNQAKGLIRTKLCVSCY